MERRVILLAQAAHAVYAALGGAEARVYGQEPFDTMGVSHLQDDERALMDMENRFRENVDGAPHTVLYRTRALVSVERFDLGPV